MKFFKYTTGIIAYLIGLHYLLSFLFLHYLIGNNHILESGIFSFEDLIFSTGYIDIVLLKACAIAFIPILLFECLILIKYRDYRPDFDFKKEDFKKWRLTHIADLLSYKDLSHFIMSTVFFILILVVGIIGYFTKNFMAGPYIMTFIGTIGSYFFFYNNSKRFYRTVLLIFPLIALLAQNRLFEVVKNTNEPQKNYLTFKYFDKQIPSTDLLVFLGSENILMRNTITQEIKIYEREHVTNIRYVPFPKQKENDLTNSCCCCELDNHNLINDQTKNKYYEKTY